MCSIAGMAKLTALNTWRANICFPEECVSAKKNFRRGRVVPEFPVDGTNRSI